MSFICAVKLIGRHGIRGIEIRSLTDIHFEDMIRRRYKLHRFDPTIGNGIDRRRIFPADRGFHSVLEQYCSTLWSRSRNLLYLHYTRSIAIELSEIHTCLVRIIHLIRYILHQQCTRYFELPTRLNHADIHNSCILCIRRIKSAGVTDSNGTRCGSRPYIADRIILPLYVRHNHMTIDILSNYVNGIPEVHELRSIHTVIERIRLHL